MNSVGGFQCLCENGTTGHLCQYVDVCQPDKCPEGMPVYYQ